MRLAEEKVFKDPIHQYIYVQDILIWQLINTKAFQRLRRIKQLGTSFFTFHGAEHSRFSHSLGVYEITRRMISVFERNRYIDWQEDEKIVTLTSALLHDIGHGPFSHSLEKIFNFNHEDWSKKLILEEPEINRLLQQFDKDLPGKIVRVLDKTYDNKVTVNMISSQLDADRMDYLLRDAYFTGVNYGTYDLERILRVLRPYKNDLVVKESGMHSIEDYLMSRYQMYRQVYFHPVTRSGEIILRKIFYRAKVLYEKGYHFSTLLNPIEKFFKGELTIEDYLAIDDAFVYTLFNFWTREQDKILSDLTTRFINRRLFQYIECHQMDKEKMKNIIDLFIKHEIDPNYYFEIDAPSDLPYDMYKYEEKGSRFPIHLLDRHGNTHEISQRSDIIATIVGKRKTISNIYYPIDLLKRKNIYDAFYQLVHHQERKKY